MEYMRCERIPLKPRRCRDMNEMWVHDRIVEDPSLLGLGKLELVGRERIQPGAGRLDLLLEHPDRIRRYEVEIQLGKTDESHIIRTIEYWDVERRRYPQYDHCAVIVAEDITSRFFNVISLFNGAIPLIALQMHALSVSDYITLHFVKILDTRRFGLDDGEGATEPATRDYWVERCGNDVLAIVDTLFEWLHEYDPGVQLSYRQHFIGLIRDGNANNCVVFRPRQNAVNLELRIDESGEVDGLLMNAVALLPYRKGRYRMQVTAIDLDPHHEIIRAMLRRACEENAGGQ
jgi:hypothetical protein